MLGIVDDDALILGHGRGGNQAERQRGAGERGKGNLHGHRPQIWRQGFGHGCTYQYLIIVVNIVTLLQSVAVPQTFVILR
jgi:hypothetical protein